MIELLIAGCIYAGIVIVIQLIKNRYDKNRQ